MAVVKLDRKAVLLRVLLMKRRSGLVDEAKPTYTTSYAQIVPHPHGYMTNTPT